ncbi:hypothetical protein I4U23_022045 [Adineta vaga]|nr:hypothetical protein I4U23_022045 [Adineta vaga]
MNFEEINYQYPPMNETALHVATRNQHKEIIQMLLAYGARRSLINADGHQPYEFAETKEIEDLFQRPQSNRFIFILKSNDTIVADQPRIKCKICSLVNDINFYEWELIDQNATEKSLRFRHELELFTPMSRNDLKRKLHTIKKGYINTRLRDSSLEINTKVLNNLESALHEEEPDYIITAYTICQNFSRLLNKDMARNIIHDLNNGCSQFSCDCLYSTEDGTKAIMSILFRYDKYRKLSFIGKTYRGIVLSRHLLDHYKVDSCIMTTTFLSTSTDPNVAKMFSYGEEISDLDKHSYFCIYEITNDKSTAIDISNISEFKYEAEILILPYSSSIDRVIVTSPNALTRQRSSLNLTYKSLFIGTIFWMFFHSHTLILIGYQELAPGYYIYYFQLGIYTELIGYYSTFIRGILMSLLLIIFGIWTCKNLQDIRIRRISPFTHINGSIYLIIKKLGELV